LYFSVEHRDARYHPKAMVAGLMLEGHAKAWPLEELDSYGSAELDDLFAGKPVRVHYDKDHRSVQITDATGAPLPVVMAYWFAWYAFYPETIVYQR
jgi:hypothetical protein